MTQRPIDLPDFDASPVAEVVLGVRYTTPEKLRVFHIGRYRDVIKDEFPVFEEHALVPRGEERGLRLTTGPPPLPRCWLLNEAGTKLVQLQTDRFLHNWRKVTGEEPYPRYEAIRDEFLRRWEQFLRFLEAEGLAKPTIVECELTYVNHIPKGTCWSKPSDIPGVFTFLRDDPGLSFLPPPESLACNLRYEPPGERGKLHVALGQAVRTQDETEVLRLDLAARGSLELPRDEDLPGWFDLAREWIVRGFADLTTEKAHQCWKRKV